LETINDDSISSLEDRGDVTQLTIVKLKELRKAFVDAGAGLKFDFLILTGLLPIKDFPSDVCLVVDDFVFVVEGKSLVLKDFNAKALWFTFFPRPEELIKAVQNLLVYMGLQLTEFEFAQGYGFIENLHATLKSLADANGFRTPFMDSPAWSREDKILVADWLVFASFWPPGYTRGTITRMFMEKEGFFKGSGFGNLNITPDEEEKIYEKMVGCEDLENAYKIGRDLIEERLPYNEKFFILRLDSNGKEV
jgi:hypothetical protein